MFREGTQIGPYTLIRKLGRGGFGEVWLSERRAKFVTTKVAVKLPLDEDVDRSTIQQEAALWERASGHPNVLPIIDADEYDGQIVIVSEYAPDGSLDDWLKKHGQLPIERAVELTIQILAGLEFLHSRGIIHRDLKPANILLQGGTPRLADFGISRALRSTASSQTQNVSGTFAYMPPEGFDGKRSVQADVWAAGVNLYLLLSGRLPFPATEPSVLIASIMMRDHDPLPSEIPETLRNIVNKALAKEPNLRYLTAAEMADALRLLPSVMPAPIIAETETVERARVMPLIDPDHAFRIPVNTPAPKTERDYGDETVLRSLTTFADTAETGRSNIFGFVVAGIFLFAALGIGGYLLLSGTPENPDGQPADIAGMPPAGGADQQETVGQPSSKPSDGGSQGSEANFQGSTNSDPRGNPAPEVNAMTGSEPTAVSSEKGIGNSESPRRPTSPIATETNASAQSVRPRNEDSTTPASVSDRDEKLGSAPSMISGGVLNGKATSLPKPPYPPAARAVRASGAVSVQVVISETGSVISANAVSGHPLLRPAAVQAARGARFSPATANGRPVKVSGVLTYNFSPY